MGGCASAPKDLKGDAGSAPVPEPSKEETVEVELEGVEKVAEENVEKNEEDKKSLGSLLDEDEIKKGSAKEGEAGEVSSEKKQEQ
ncbi:hypothetical protein POPTR_003G022400v4 [Populus trichocarpa]|uniref:Uncharacterized protein n=1 Tax=Populus trichocarpa TaxID=3694 RepID=A0A2K2B0C9_POPTR|nr:hypothetical protein POPTR_003G022400v4 [Populus trichocarpa]